MTAPRTKASVRCRATRRRTALHASTDTAGILLTVVGWLSRASAFA
jgi:hypothetical protein